MFAADAILRKTLLWMIKLVKEKGIKTFQIEAHFLKTQNGILKQCKDFSFEKSVLNLSLFKITTLLEKKIY